MKVHRCQGRMEAFDSTGVPYGKDVPSFKRMTKLSDFPLMNYDSKRFEQRQILFLAAYPREKNNLG